VDTVDEVSIYWPRWRRRGWGAGKGEEGWGGGVQGDLVREPRGVRELKRWAYSELGFWLRMGL